MAVILAEILNNLRQLSAEEQVVVIAEVGKLASQLMTDAIEAVTQGGGHKCVTPPGIRRRREKKEKK